MIFKVLFILNISKKIGITSGYRPTWCCDSKPEHNSAQLNFTGIKLINPGETYQCLLQPLVSELWVNVSINNTLKCMEGSKQVGEAIILEIISSWSKGWAPVS